MLLVSPPVPPVPGRSPPLAQPSPARSHRWQFFRAGGVDQVRIRSGADLAHLGELDQKLWVALACPTRGLAFDERTLDLIDANGDDRIRAPELTAAVAWACARLRDPELLVRGGDGLRVTDLAGHSAEGAALADEALRLLRLRGQRDDDMLTLADVAAHQAQLASTRFNGDGVVAPEHPEADEPARCLDPVLRQIIDTQGGASGCDGQPGVSAATAQAFFAQARAQQRWWQRERHEPALRPLGEHSAAALAAVLAVRDKVDDFFARCRVSAFDEQAVPALNPTQDDYSALGAQLLHADAPALASLPLARVGPGLALPLRQGVNPGWAEALARLQRDALEPLGAVTNSADPQLSEAAWQRVLAQLAACSHWRAEQPDNALKVLTAEQVDALLAADTEAAVLALVAEDEAMAPQQAGLADLERLLRYQRDLLALVHNFVSFEAFYHRRGAVFQAGTLYLDGRSCDLSVQVDDIQKHARLGGMAKACLAYCECRRDGQKISIVSAFTAGDVDFLFEGRNGVFYDRNGQDWDATIVKLIDNPISIGQAFFSPYKKFVRVIEQQVAKRAAASESAVDARLDGAAARVAQAGQKPVAASPAAAPPAAPAAAGRSRRVDVGTVAALGVALGSLSAVAVGVFAKFIELGWWIPMAIAGIVLAISGPSMLIAWLKLRQRSLGPILDASGWAINGRMRVNIRLGRALSQTAQVPPGAGRQRHDPFAERHGLAWLLAGLALLVATGLVAWRFALLNPLLPEPLRVAPDVRSVPAPDGGTVTVPITAPAPALPGGAGAPRPPLV